LLTIPCVSPQGLSFVLCVAIASLIGFAAWLVQEPPFVPFVAIASLIGFAAWLVQEPPFVPYAATPLQP
jgi:hypothetical protein